MSQASRVWDLCLAVVVIVVAASARLGAADRPGSSLPTPVPHWPSSVRPIDPSRIQASPSPSERGSPMLQGGQRPRHLSSPGVRPSGRLP